MPKTRPRKKGEKGNQGKPNDKGKPPKPEKAGLGNEPDASPRDDNRGDEKRKSPSSRKRLRRWTNPTVILAAVGVVVAVLAAAIGYNALPRSYLISHGYNYRRDLGNSFLFGFKTSGTALEIVATAFTTGSSIPDDCGSPLTPNIKLTTRIIPPDTEPFEAVPLHGEPSKEEIERGYYIYGWARYADVSWPKREHTTFVCVRRILLNEASFEPTDALYRTPFIPCERCNEAE